MRILLLCNYEPYNAAMVSDHINAFTLYSIHDIVVCSTLVKNQGNIPDRFSLEEFDVVIIHYSIFLAVDAYVSAKTKDKLKIFQGIKGIFLQDEYRFVNHTVELIAEIGFHVVFTCIPEESIKQVYPPYILPGVQFINVLTGYVPEALLAYKPLSLKHRKFDVSYRGRKYPLWHGRLGLEKWQIADKFLQDAKYFKLRCNISYKERDRLYGARWVNLLQNSIAVLGVESGSSVCDFTGEISANVETMQALLKLDDYEFYRRHYFADLEDKIYFAQISPRCFEAIALRTLCILYEGEYSGILTPWRHFVPLKKDHSNMAEIVACLKDSIQVSTIISNAYSEIAANPKYSYQNFIKRVDVILNNIKEAKHIDISKSLHNQSKLEQKLLQVKDPYSWTIVRNPHAISNRSYSILTFIKQIIPNKWKQLIKSLINNFK
ncbi:hypothetical protein [Candidatus Tisiphia endosymbiont of Nemotelus uliginosus]|uniref:hypothetical protein n=1 Tax=Candidatus Tisiphia endosymbiont of Nemotelus uliginosus TaxID=3077926 RepID=UPI0035C92177